MEGLVDDLQQQPLLWIHDLGLRGAQPEEARVEAVCVLDEAAVAHRHHARSLAPWLGTAVGPLGAIWGSRGPLGVQGPGRNRRGAQECSGEDRTIIGEWDAIEGHVSSETS